MKFFSRNKESSDPSYIIKSCLKTTLNRISDSFDEEGYHWNKPWGVKRYESMLLAKFIIDYSFNRLVDDELSDDEKKGYYDLSQSFFTKTFNDEFSEVGLNYEDMQEEIENKIESYFTARREYRRPPECWHKIFMLLTNSPSKEELDESLKKKNSGLDLMRANETFAPMIPQYEAQINLLKKKVETFDIAEMMMSHMIRSSRQRLKTIKLKKIIAISKKLAKKEKKK